MPGWQSRGRNATAPNPNVTCSNPGCSPATNDAGWRTLDLPHDFVVEGNFSSEADPPHGFLPFGVAWYRKHITFPANAQGAPLWIDFQAIQTTSTVYFNGKLLGYHGYGYTNSRYFLNASQINWGGDNLLAVFVDATAPDSWWCVCVYVMSARECVCGVCVCVRGLVCLCPCVLCVKTARKCDGVD
ncbi:MAG: hypothetical protein P4L40_24710 [Terracidiphilus sp.]|nr:hypothetical protein [Terracidiphilus sp.]